MGKGSVSERFEGFFVFAGIMGVINLVILTRFLTRINNKQKGFYSFQR